MDATEISRTSEGIFGQACRYHRPERGRDSDEFTELSKRDREKRMQEREFYARIYSSIS